MVCYACSCCYRYCRCWCCSFCCSCCWCIMNDSWVICWWWCLAISQQKNSGLLGTAAVDTTTSLLAMLDEAKDLHACTFNNAVVQRALKSLVIQDVQISAWERLATTTLATIESRFVAESFDDGSWEDFYIMITTQTFQKLCKQVSLRYKPKENLTYFCLFVGSLVVIFFLHWLLVR